MVVVVVPTLWSDLKIGSCQYTANHEFPFPRGPTRGTATVRTSAQFDYLARKWFLLQNSPRALTVVVCRWIGTVVVLVKDMWNYHGGDGGLVGGYEM